MKKIKAKYLLNIPTFVPGRVTRFNFILKYGPNFTLSLDVMTRCVDIKTPCFFCAFMVVKIHIVRICTTNISSKITDRFYLDYLYESKGQYLLSLLIEANPCINRMFSRSKASFQIRHGDNDLTVITRLISNTEITR